ncbi:hypothetical protein ACJIZ3_007134 [Penstemon smallii]|uniref:RING-type E3 ubiquitin transferase n=1 Tax=Penstemon smallii TaxID=265156 RepID=A0ABD3S9N0_9LAMI
MGHRNTQVTGNMIDYDANHKGHSHLHPEPSIPCIFYGTVPNFPQANIHSIVPSHYDNSALLYRMPQYNAIQPQHPVANLDLAVGAPPGHYNPYLVHPVQVNQGPHDQFSLPTNHRIVGIPTDSYGRNIPYVDGLRESFKIKNAVGPHANYQYHAASVGPSSSVPPMIARPAESHWLDMHFGANHGVAWTQAPPPNLPYVHGVHGFMHPPIPQGHPYPHHPMQGGVRGYNGHLPSQVATSSHRVPPVHDVVDVGPTFLAPVPPTGFQLYRPHRREIGLDLNGRHRNLPHLRVLPEDEVAMLEVSSYQDAGDSIDQHREMRLDTDYMSYEELLALGEQIGSVGTGLSEDVILKKLKTRIFTSSAACVNLGDGTCLDQQINLCAICQTDYENEENIGTLDCGHEYHRECIKKWLLVKNTCPVCKSTALDSKGKDL